MALSIRVCGGSVERCKAALPWRRPSLRQTRLAGENTGLASRLQLGSVTTAVSLGRLPKTRLNRWALLNLLGGQGGGRAELWAEGGLGPWWLQDRAVMESKGGGWGEGPPLVGRRGRSESRSVVKMPCYSLTCGAYIPQSMNRQILISIYWTAWYDSFISTNSSCHHLCPAAWWLRLVKIQNLPWTMEAISCSVYLSSVMTVSDRSIFPCIDVGLLFASITGFLDKNNHL